MIPFPVILKLTEDNPGLRDYILSLAKTAYYSDQQARLYWDLSKRYPELTSVVLWCSPSIVFDTVDIILTFNDGSRVKKIVEWDKGSGFGGGNIGLEVVAEEMCQDWSLQKHYKPNPNV